MPINQFAKISPLVDSEGYLLPVNQDGTVIENPEEMERRRLKNNELGIVYKDNAIVTMYNGTLVRLSGGGVFNNESDLNEFIKDNTDGHLNGVICALKRYTSFRSIPDMPEQDYEYYDLVIVNNTSFFNISEKTKRTLVIDVNDANKDSLTQIDSYPSSDTYVSHVPYFVTNITTRIKRDILYSSNNEIFKGTLCISTMNEVGDVLDQFPFVKITGDIESSKFEIFESFSIDRDFFGKIHLSFFDENSNNVNTTDIKNVDALITIEYIV